MKQSTVKNSNEKIASFIDNVAVKEKIISFRVSHSQKTKEEIFNMIFPYIKKLIQIKLARFKEYWDELYQEAGIVVNEYLEKPLYYDPEKDGLFCDCIKKAVLIECWSTMYSYKSSLPSKKAAISMYFEMKKFRKENTDLSEEELDRLCGRNIKVK